MTNQTFYSEDGHLRVDLRILGNRVGIDVQATRFGDKLKPTKAEMPNNFTFLYDAEVIG